MEILQETNYDKFKFINGNRDISKKKVKKICESYKSGVNLFPYCPVLVNPQFYVVDGQHRISACQELKIPVFYIVAPELTLQQIAQINSNTDKWKNSDFLNCYIKIGVANYKTLQLFKSKHGISLSVAIGLLMDGRAKGGSHDGMEKFREGTFAVKYHERAEMVMQKCYNYIDVNPNNWNDTNFIVAIEKLMACTQTYNHTEVIQKLRKNGSKIEKKRNYKEYIYEIENLFNKGNSTRKIIYNK